MSTARARSPSSSRASEPPARPPHLHLQRLGLIRSHRLAVDEQKLTLLPRGARHHHRGAVVGPADHERLTAGNLSAAPIPTRNLRPSVIRSGGNQGIAGWGNRGKRSAANADLKAAEWNPSAPPSASGRRPGDRPCWPWPADRSFSAAGPAAAVRGRRGRRR